MALSAQFKQKTSHKKIANDSASRIIVLIFGCFFVSGLTGLIYEVLWTRMIVKIIGSAPFAVSIVLTVFMGGLGLGSYIASKTIDQIKNPLKLIRLYGVLELVIGVYGIILPLLLILFRPLYAFIYNHLFSYFLGYNLITFVGCFLLLIIPVTCMGATLPVLSRFFITSISRVGTHVGRLYGLNTIGAAAGALLCGFWLISSLGMWGSLFFAIIMNATIGLLCVLISYRYQRKDKTPRNMTETAIKIREKEFPEPDSPITRSYDISALTIFAVSGFCAMAYEVIWTKLLGLIAGPTTYSFTIVLVAFISGLAIGSIFFGWFGDRIKNILLLLLITQVAAAVFALLASQLMGNSQIFFAKLIVHFKDNFTHLQILKAAILFTVMFFPTFCLGATFPLVGKILTRSLSRTGRSIGLAYAINSIGAILGSFCAGFLLIPLMGKEQALRLVILIQLLTPLCIGGFFILRDKTWNRSLATVMILPILLGLILLIYFPHWDRKMLSVGMYHRFDRPEIRGISWVKALVSGKEFFPEHEESEIVYFGDGIGGFVTVLKTDLDQLGNKGYALYSSGKPEASSKLDMDTQTLSAHVPMLFHKDPKRVLVVGLASGITAGEFLNYPISKLDIIDINRQMVGASDFFRTWNNNVLSHPKTELIIQDARAHMELSTRTYDVISSEPSNPWMAGLATLFTKDFFTLVKSRLNDQGIFVQFIHTYQMDWSTFALVGRTFSQVFPNSLLMRTNPSSLGPDFLLVGFNGTMSLDEKIMEQRIGYSRKSQNVSSNNPRVLFPLIVSEDLQTLFGNGSINTDARPWLEFSAPKLLYANDPMIRERLNTNRSLKKETLAILKEAATDVDFQIDYVEFALSLIRPGMIFQNPVDVSRATQTQKDRLYSILEKYCKENIVTDFSLFGDPALKKKCILAQIDAVRERIPIADNKAILYTHIGMLNAKIGKIDDALRSYAEALRIEPDNADVQFDTALFLSTLGRIREAVEHYSKALRINHYYVEAYNNLAWIFSTYGDSDIRDGKKAVEMAEKAYRLSDGRDPSLLDTLAAAYAEEGRFIEAMETARRGMDMALRDGENGIAEEIKARLELYKSNRPYREDRSVAEN
jgi:spermidine synthase